MHRYLGGAGIRIHVVGIGLEIHKCIKKPGRGTALNLVSPPSLHFSTARDEAATLFPCDRFIAWPGVWYELCTNSRTPYIVHIMCIKKLVQQVRPGTKIRIEVTPSSEKKICQTGHRTCTCFLYPKSTFCLGHLF